MLDRDAGSFLADPYSALSIGALSRAAGVPVETLRTWERRYGFPSAKERADAGHRRYPLDTVPRLRLAVRAIALGHKPSQVLRASQATLESLLAVSAPAPSKPLQAPRIEGSFLERCLASIVRLDADEFAGELDQAWSEKGAIGCLLDCVAPLIDAIGLGWSRGELEVGHEHFGSEVIREFLGTRWRQLNERARGPNVVCATPVGEPHVLGLHIAATVISLAGARVVFLGANTPTNDIVKAVEQTRASAVVLSSAEGASAAALANEVRALLHALPRGVPVAVGGRGFHPPPAGVLSLPGLHDLGDWARQLKPPG